jgi:hypothetical protein
VGWKKQDFGPGNRSVAPRSNVREAHGHRCGVMTPDQVPGFWKLVSALAADQGRPAKACMTKPSRIRSQRHLTTVWKKHAKALGKRLD